MANGKDQFYVLECSAENCRAEFYVNDFPIAKRGKEWGFFYGAPVNEFIVSGHNTITAVIEPGDRPATALTGSDHQRRRRLLAKENPDKEIPPAEIKVKAALRVYPRGAIVGGPDGEELAALEWSPEADLPLMFPLVRAAAVEINPPFGPWAWQTYAPLVLDEASHKEIMAFIEDLHLAFMATFHQPLIEKSAIRFADIEAAHYLPPGDRARTAAEVLKDRMEDLDWKMKALDGLQPDVRLCAQDRMIQLIAADWEAILRQEPDAEGRGIYFPLMISKVQGEWLIVR